METSQNIYYIFENLEISKACLPSQTSVAWASYKNNMDKCGWIDLKITTSSKYSDKKQVYAAGYLEGYLCQEEMFYAYKNYVSSVLHKKENLSKNAISFIEDQLEWIDQQINLNANNSYWNLVECVMLQLRGMYDGYMKKIKIEENNDQTLDFFHFYYLTNMGDLQDIIPAFENSNEKQNYLNCSGFIKLTNNDLITCHNTHNIYSLMLRVFKTYHFNLHNSLVKCKSMSFTSRPGDLESKDDYYILSSNLVVFESSLSNYNDSLYSKLNPKTLPTWIRALIANRASLSSKEWSEFFSLNNSGTHNNQWCIVDYSRYWEYISNNVEKESWNNIVWLLEQFFEIIDISDVTQKLVKSSYFATFNHPFSQKIYEIGNYSNKNPEDYRKNIFEKNSILIGDIEDAKQLILSTKNDKNDLSISIAPRYDLLEKNPIPFGAIDGKAIDGSLLQNKSVWIVGSPPHEEHPPFDFRKFPDFPHQGIPELMNFKWILQDINTVL